MSTAPDDQEVNKSLLCAVLEEDAIALVRVVGRGNFANSMALKRFAAHVLELRKADRFIVDLQECESMDSTFMGVLAGVAIGRNQNGMHKLIVLNAGDHNRRLLKNLGLLPLIEVRSGDGGVSKEAEGLLKPAEGGETNRLDQICLTLQAHKTLIQLDEQNEVRFQAVIEYLEKSLEAGDTGAPTF